VVQPWLQSLELVAQPDLLISSPDRTLTEIAPMLDRVVGIDLDSGVDVRKLTAAIASGIAEGTGATRLVIGSEPDRVFEQLDRFSVVEVAATMSPARMPSKQTSAAMVGLHGFSETSAAPDNSFTMQMIDDWGIDDVMATALDLASRQGRALAVLFDLAVLDPVFDRERTIPGGLDMRRLFRAARACGRRPDVAAAGFAKAGSDLNLVYAVLSFCAGLAAR
jgi:arginase family enzyme